MRNCRFELFLIINEVIYCSSWCCVLLLASSVCFLRLYIEFVCGDSCAVLFLLFCLVVVGVGAWIIRMSGSTSSSSCGCSMSMVGSCVRLGRPFPRFGASSSSCVIVIFPTNPGRSCSAECSWLMRSLTADATVACSCVMAPRMKLNSCTSRLLSAMLVLHAIAPAGFVWAVATASLILSSDLCSATSSNMAAYSLSRAHRPIS